MSEPRSLFRIRDGRVVAGVVGGIAARFGWNPTLTRVGYVLVSAFSAAFPGILAVSYTHPDVYKSQRSTCPASARAARSRRPTPRCIRAR